MSPRRQTAALFLFLVIVGIGAFAFISRPSSTSSTPVMGWNYACEQELGAFHPNCEESWHIATRIATEAALVAQQPAPPIVDPAVAQPVAPVVPIAPAPLPEERVVDTAKGLSWSWQIFNGNALMAPLLGILAVVAVIGLYIGRKYVAALIALVAIVGMLIAAWMLLKGTLGFVMGIVLLLGLMVVAVVAIMGFFGFKFSKGESSNLKTGRNESYMNAGFQGQLKPTPEEKELDF